MTTPGTTGIATAADFKKARPRGVEFDLPSGFKCLVKRPGITELIAEGLFPDSLMSLVSGFVDTGHGKKPQDRQKSAKQIEKDAAGAMNAAMREITDDPKKLKEMLLTVDRAFVYCMIAPAVKYNRYPDDHEVESLRGTMIPESEREEGLLYVDEVDDDDKMAVFHFAVGGDEDEMNDLAKFPDSGEDVGVVSDGKDVVVPTKRPAKRR